MLLWLLACAHDLPETWSLGGDGFGVTIDRAPYTLTLTGPGGTLLRTTPGGEGDGYAGAAFTEGTTAWDTIVSPGWFSFQADLDPYTDAWVVVAAAERPSVVELTFAPAESVDERGRVADDEGRRMIVTHSYIGHTLRVEARVEGMDAPRAWSVGFESPADEAFLGFGERFNRTDQRGVAVYAWAEEGGLGLGEGRQTDADNPFPNGEAMSYYPVPFFVSTRGYGFYLDTTWRSQFELATERDDAWRVWSIAPTLAYEVYLGDTTSAAWPYTLIDAFTAAVGRPMVPPAWAFGPRRRVGGGSTVDGVPEIQKLRDEDIALTIVDDAVHFLPQGSHVGIEDELRRWTTEAAALGYKALCYYNAHLADTPDNPLLAEVTAGKANGWFVTDTQGTPSIVTLISGEALPVLTVDMTNPDARTWFGEMLSWAVDLGYSGWMYDFGEYIQPGDVAWDGTTGEEWHNRFPRDYQAAAHEALQASAIADDWLLFARSGTAGASQWVPVVWSGDPAASFEDSDGLPAMVRGAMNIGISGVPTWGSDIGGFHCVADGAGAADGELLTRWIEFGSMTPDMHDENACSGSFDGLEKATIWTSDDARAAWRTYGRLHTRMLPYFYTLAQDAHRTGAPAVRQLFLDHPDDPTLATVDDAFHLGPALLVAPVLERGARSRVVRVADDAVMDWRDGRRYGSGDITVDAPLGDLPLFLRDGGLLPLLDPSIDTLAPEDHPDVVGPDDVADVYDVVGFFTTGHGGEFTVYDGTALAVTWAGGFAPPDLPAAGSEAELSTCAACWRADTYGDVQRVRVSTTAGEVRAGGLTLSGASTRRLRWDVYLGE